MGSGIFYPVVNGDNGYWYPPSTLTSSDDLYFGDLGGGFTVDVFARFVNVTIPQGSVITTAKIKWRAAESESVTDVLTNIFFNDSDDAVAPTSYAEAEALDLTDLVAWDNIPAWVYDSYYFTVELKAIVQEIIDREGWESGNALMAIVKDDGSSDGAFRDAYSIYVDPGYDPWKPELHVEWSDAPEPTEVITDLSSSIVALRSKWWLNTDIQAATDYPDRDRFLMVRHDHVPERDEQNVLTGKAMRFRLYNPEVELGIDLTTFKMRFDEGDWYRYGDSRLTFTEVNSREYLVYFNPPNFTYDREIMIEVYCEDKAHNPGIKLEIL